MGSLSIYKNDNHGLKENKRSDKVFYTILRKTSLNSLVMKI